MRVCTARLVAFSHESRIREGNPKEAFDFPSSFPSSPHNPTYYSGFHFLFTITTYPQYTPTSISIYYSYLKCGSPNVF